eukprot:TRINITY_DN1784_c0_g1_i4.p1 TRINITY_DN1784_c0_g1~~TRINITY_DN1784_c0_g1_i4.p1  ORF type:complete len:532 (+),score=67.97 TRINITY_DN1784_c0_g1_i4:132-1727(+)
MMVSLFSLFVVVSLVKVLLIPAYFSTDFEVHRNWLAITNNLPIDKWYYEKTSEWTLDYPPLFAWFEYGLSFLAKIFVPSFLEITEHHNPSQKEVIFHRLTVIISDLLLFYAVYQITNTLYHKSSSSKKNESEGKGTKSILENQSFWKNNEGILIGALALFNPGLLIVDHIHFQYNGFLTGIQILSMNAMLNKQYIWGAFLFATLLNCKHIYMYMAPVYFVFLLRYCCFEPSKNKFRFGNFILLGVVVLLVFGISLGPFLLMGQIPQLLSRLFPFGRGLSHAYWAPNFWAFYNTVDRLLIFLNNIFGLKIFSATSATMLTGGLVGSDSQAHVALPNILPIHTILITVISLIPLLYWSWSKYYEHRDFIIAVSLSTLCFFMFGWHVHEKAILMVILPLTLLAGVNADYARLFFFLSTVGHYSLFPLLFTPLEAPIKICLWGIYTLASYVILKNLHGPAFRLSALEALYLFGLLPLCLFVEILYPLVLVKHSPFLARMVFLPLLMNSLYCGVGVLYTFLKMYKVIFSAPNKKTV